MKKLILITILSIALTGCEKEEDNGCTCKGKFTIDNGQTYFYAYGVDCNTGHRNGNPIQSNALYLGCND